MSGFLGNMRKIIPTEVNQGSLRVDIRVNKIAFIL